MKTDKWTKAGSDRDWRVKCAELGMMRHQKHCIRCGVLFAARRADAKFCGSRCRQAAHRDRQRAARLEAARANPTPRAEHTRRRQEITDRRLATKRAQVIPFTCAHCGRESYTDGTATARIYCANGCRQAAYRARKAASRIADERAFIAEARKRGSQV